MGSGGCIGGCRMPDCLCPKCGSANPIPFQGVCGNNCGFNLNHLAGKTLSAHQVKKKLKHNELIYGDTISLYGGEFNASFIHSEESHLDGLVRYAISFGDRATVPSPRGKHQNPVIVAFTPQTVGSGTSTVIYPKQVPCSGVCIISPASKEWGHPFPVMDEWVRSALPDLGKKCPGGCGSDLGFGIPFCGACFAARGGNWQALI